MKKLALRPKSIARIRKASNRNRYDSAWKKVIHELFKDFLQFFFPEIHDAIDFSKKITFLDNELKEIIPDSNIGDKIADVVVKVHLLNGSLQYLGIIIHMEVQGDPRSEFMHRMFIYYYRTVDREMDKNIPVISVAMLTDDDPNFRKDVYEFKLFGFEIRMKIPIVKILDYKTNPQLREKLETSTNPMSMIVRAQLKSLELKKADKDTKFEVTKELIRQCYQLKFSRNKTRIILFFFSWVIRLPDSLKQRIKQVIHEVEEELKMEYVPIWERDTLRKGIRQGIKKGELKAAKKLLKAGVDINIISKSLGFTVEEIKQLAMSAH